MGCGRGICASTVLLCMGIAALCAGITIVCLLPSMVRRQVEKAVVLDPNSETVKSWSEPPVQASIQFWLFNVSNPDQILYQGAKPALFQKGPYGFREHLEKVNVSFSSDNTVFFSAHKEYYFSPDLSCSTCTLNDIYTVPNIPYFTVMKLVRSQSAARGILDFLGGILLRLVGEHPFVGNITAGQLLFDGYDDQIFKLVNQFKPGFLPEKMGLFYGRNGSEDGPYQVYTGMQDVTKLGRIVTWQGRHDLSELGWWNPNYTQASMINGSDGGMYPPFVSKSDRFSVFSRELCRSLYLHYHSTVDTSGLPSYRFQPAPDVFTSSGEANSGFCWPSNERYYSDRVQPKLDGGYCLPTGMMDVSKCYKNAQIVMSSPQFQFCPDEVLDTVDGLYAPSDDFITRIDIEPTTGVVLAASKKLQLNVEMYADSNKAQVFKKMKPVIVPIVWMNESIAVDETTRRKIYDKLITSQYTAHAGSYTAIGIGAFFIVLGLIGILFIKMKQRRNAVGDKFFGVPEQVDPSEIRN